MEWLKEALIPLPLLPTLGEGELKILESSAPLSPKAERRGVGNPGRFCSPLSQSCEKGS
jgi:hypothetical protein